MTPKDMGAAPAPSPPSAGGMESISLITASQLNAIVVALLTALALLVLLFATARARELLLQYLHSLRARARARRAQAERGPTLAADTGAASRQVGLTEEAIAQSGQVFRFGDVEECSSGEGCGSEGKECIVCLVEYCKDDDLRRLDACGHAFHRGCVDAWLASHASCPLCRTRLAGAGEPKESATASVEPSVELVQGPQETRTVPVGENSGTSPIPVLPV